MLFPKVEQYLTEVISFVKFRSDREAIKSELESHMIDRIDDYIALGYDKEIAEQLSIDNMGDAREIGKALNKEHNPILGLIWKLTNMLVVGLLIWNIFYICAFIIPTFIDHNLVKDIPKSDIVYRVDIKETVKLDDMVINFTNIIYEENGDLNIFYNYYSNRFWSSWSFGGGLTITDNLGNSYFAGGGQGSGGLISYYMWTFSDFSKDAETVFISYDYYNRSFQVEIPLKVGEKIE
ncbi:MAG: permease prefix domain 1-containing protein [Mobilitalea sp.]